MELAVIEPDGETEMTDVETLFFGHHGNNVAVPDTGEQIARSIESLDRDVVDRATRQFGFGRGDGFLQTGVAT